MLGIVIITHGNLAAELLSAVQHIVGIQSHIKTVCIGPNDDMDQRRNEITVAIKSVDLGKGVVLVNGNAMKLGDVASMQDYCCTVLREGACSDAAEAPPRSGHEDDAIFEQIDAGLVGFEVDHSHLL